MINFFVINRIVGNMVAFLFQNKIPYSGVTISTNCVSIPAYNKAALAFRMYEGAERRFVVKYLLQDILTIELRNSIGAVSSQIAKLLSHAIASLRTVLPLPDCL